MPSASHEVSPSASYEVSPIAPYEVVEFVCCKENHNVNNFDICMRNDTIFSSCNSHDLNVFREITLINDLCVSSFILYQSTSMIYQYSVILQDTHQYIVIPLWVCTSQIREIPYLSTVLIKLAFTMLHVCLSIYDEFKLMSMLYAEWADSTLIWLSENLHSMFIFTKTTEKLIRRICIYIQQGTLRHHDFAVLQPGFNKPTCIFVFLLHIIASTVACPKVLDRLHVYVINHAVTYYSNTDVVETSGQSTVIIPDVKQYVFEYDDIIENTQINKKVNTQMITKNTDYIGGGKGSMIFYGVELMPYAYKGSHINNEYSYRYVGHGTKSLLESIKHDKIDIVCRIPLVCIVKNLTRSSALSLSKQHGMLVNTRSSKSDIISEIYHSGPYLCKECLTAFRHVETREAYKHNYYKRKISNISKINTKKVVENKFPPPPSTMQLSEMIIKDFISATSPNEFEEGGCAVCGTLSLKSNLTELTKANVDLNILVADGSGFTRKERYSSLDPIVEFHGPILETQCKHICKTCMTALKHNKKPKFSLSRGLWIGAVPPQLKCLRYFERLLVARVRHNRCVFRVSVGSSKINGMSKMVANAITFEQPVPKLYMVLPPPIKEMNDCIAFIFTGPTKPTQEDYKRTPLLVRRKNILDALEWLKLNHRDYADLEISYRNLEEYPEDVPPVVIDYRHRQTNKDTEATSVHDMEPEDGTRNGICPLTVHGITGEQYVDASTETLKTIALEHLTDMGKFIAIGRAEEPESIWKNPTLYPKMFPWLFPYGLGCIGEQQHKGLMSDAAHKRHLLMYHDKRFQTDHEFCLIAFNHEQIKDATTGGFLMTEKNSFDSVAERLVNIDPEVLKGISRRMVNGEKIYPDTDQEKACFDILKDVDHVGGHVNGSITNKRYMRNEIWSLTCFKGAPSWYITLSPTDNKHPICLYFADKDTTFNPSIRSSDERLRLISDNPVAGARFFHFMVSSFIEHVLGIRENPRNGIRRNNGLFGRTSAYYGTVEQQGRLTLHLHMVLWIINSLTPQEIRDKIMDEESAFQKSIVEYLESVHIGEFLTGSHREVQQNVSNSMIQCDYINPTESLPVPPPSKCRNIFECGSCINCNDLKEWRINFRNTVDDILLRSNIHTCRGGSKEYETKYNKDQGNSKNIQEKFHPITGCKSNKYGKCKARFPQKLLKQMVIDPKTGSIDIKKGEPWMNTINPTVTYLLRCNTDVTSLLSGTAIKAVIAYISDYITKPTLKTYVVFDTIVSIFEKNSEMINGSIDRREAARRVLTQIVNSLTAKMEIGAPMAAMYLLGNPDHYTDHKFRTFYWKSYVCEARSPWQMDTEYQKGNKVGIKNKGGRIMAITPVHDYTFRPVEYDNICLYDWI